MRDRLDSKNRRNELSFVVLLGGPSKGGIVTPGGPRGTSNANARVPQAPLSRVLSTAVRGKADPSFEKGGIRPRVPRRESKGDRSLPR